MRLRSRVSAILFFVLVTATAVLPARPAATDDLKRARAELIHQTEAYADQVRMLLSLEQSSRGRIEEGVLRRRHLYNDGLIARVELEQSEGELRAVDLRIAELLRQIRNSEDLIAEVHLALEQDELASDDSVIRHAGATPWSLGTVSKIQAFFEERFGQPLPVSAYGQTALHNRFGLMHAMAIDVALHPDSLEGQALLEYLRKSGLPFIAFRAALRGSATGAHIHIGPPSQRVHVAL